MRAFLRTTCPTFALTFLLAGNIAVAQNQCAPGFTQLSDAIELHLAGKALIAANADTPLAVPSATQLEAPASTDAGGSLVSRPGLASLLGLAHEQGLIKSEDDVTTISLTPFSFLALAKPEYTYNQILYANSLAQQLRRFGGSLVLGGKGDSFDRDGDGKPDEALQAKKMDDIVTWEVKYQIGSRDRRDNSNFKYFHQTLENANAFQSVHQNFGDLITALDAPTQLLTQNPPNSGCFRTEELAVIFQRQDIAQHFENLKLAQQDYEAIAEKVFDKIDRKPILTLVYGGTQRGTEFGPDKRLAALRGAFTLWGGTNAVEASWSETENLLGVRDAVTWKLGWEYSRLFLKGSALSKDGVSLALAGSYEMLDNVPMAKHDTISKLNAKFTIPLAEGIDVPISITWANHKDLLTEEKELQGHIGFTVSLKKLQEQLLGKKEK